MPVADKLGLAHVVSRKPFRKLGVFFLGHACLDYPAAVRRVISFSHGKTSFGCAWCPLTNRRKTGCKAELFLKNPKNYFEGFSSGVSRISRVWGRHSPTRFPQGQNERKANFGTAVESCSEKLPLSSAADFAAIYKGRCGCFRQYSDCGGVSCPPLFPSTDRNGKCQTLIWIFHHYYGRQAHFGQTSPSLTTTRERGVLPKMGAKNATDFQKSVALLFGAVFNFSLPFPLLGKRKGQPILAVL